MKYPSLHTLERLEFAGIPSGRLAEYAYALNCLKFPVSVVSGEWFQGVDDICDCKIADLRCEINRRLGHNEDTEILTHALAVLDGRADLIKGGKSCIRPFSQMSVSELVGMHSLSGQWYDMRRKAGMEVFTRAYQWQIVDDLLKRKDGKMLAAILLLAECVEADNYAHNISLPYTIGERVKSFVPTDYASDEDMRQHINALSRKADYASREELIQIADHIQTEIVAKGETAKHMALVNAILCTGMPSFDYPKIVREFEKATKSLAKADEKKEIELAPYFYSLWGLTQKSTYLNRFEKTVRRCYLSLANDKHFPGLGVNIEDSASVECALRFLDEYRLNVWILNDKYDVDKVIGKYHPAL
ncbi:MAG: hypothetical protein NC418_02605 [Muribaculaceae bacterium]|nr:hypothetical protein [Muribaculaceae bacterium]